MLHEQTIVPASAGHAESSPPESPARELSGQRVLRSGRSAPGQVRDAAASGRRQTTGQPGGKEFWLFAAVLLSGTDSISGGWPQWASATQTRAAIWAQADQRTNAVCDTTSGGRTRGSRVLNWRIESRSGSASRFTLADRPSVAASKKTPVSPQTGCPFSSRSPAGCRLRRSPLSSSTRMAARTGSGTADHSRVPLLDGGLQPPSRYRMQQ